METVKLAIVVEATEVLDIVKEVGRDEEVETPRPVTRFNGGPVVKFRKLDPNCSPLSRVSGFGRTLKKKVRDSDVSAVPEVTVHIYDFTAIFPK